MGSSAGYLTIVQPSGIFGNLHKCGEIPPDTDADYRLDGSNINLNKDLPLYGQISSYEKLDKTSHSQTSNHR